ncbi:unnamed protein product [Owenia fusiformis]|uniref:G-protein coupled receptors family 1 profile domain-containing protein n=1 Tax=Owenia fusiformis TaxID=6347 RepID=A0A8S4NMA1_OWEFU|nr:unnamed protein product [Owenia fusiformis]
MITQNACAWELININSLFEKYIEVEDTGTLTMQPFLNQWTGHINGTRVAGFQTLMTMQMFVDKLKWYYTPTIITIGLLGNLLSVIVFTQTTYRKVSAAFYLAMLAVFDSIFLMTLLLIWVSNFGFNLYNTEGWCQFTLYASLISCFMSEWCVVAFALERFIILCCKPNLAKLCSMFRTKFLLIGLMIFAVCFYFHHSWTAGIIQLPMGPMCSPLPNYMKIIQILNIIDILVNLLIPDLTIIVMTSVITIEVIKRFRKNRLLLRSSTSRSTQTNNLDTENEPQPTRHESDVSAALSEIERKLNVTRLFFGTVIVYLICHVPSHVLRLKMFLTSILDPVNLKMSFSDYTFQQFFHYLYFTNFGIKFFIYVTICSAYRRGMKEVGLNLYNKIHKALYKRRYHGEMAVNGHNSTSIEDQDATLASLIGSNNQKTEPDATRNKQVESIV